MLFILTPQNPAPVSYDPEEAFLEYKRREYVAALQEQQQRAQFERELAIEEERHRIALASIAQQEAARRQRQASVRFARPATEAPRRFCRQPAPEEILARRQAREQEEQRRSRQFHEHILSQIFGTSTEQASNREAPSTSSSVDKRKQSTVKRPRNEEPQPHWSAAPERARALAEITTINRTYTSLKNTFAFPSGPLERLAGSDLPRLAFNSTNASIHAFEHALSELLSKLDGVESHGFKGVREARKQLVVKIEKELEELEQKVSERLAEGASPAVPTTAIPDVVVPIEEVQSKEVEDTVMVDEQTANTEVAHDTTPAGYDVEPEQPVEAAVSHAMEVEPVEAPVHSSKPASRSASPVPIPTENVDPQPVDAEVTDSTTTPAPATVPATISLELSTSDEDSEIEDAVHIIIEEEEAVAHDHRSDASDQEVEFELI